MLLITQQKLQFLSIMNTIDAHFFYRYIRYFRWFGL